MKNIEIWSRNQGVVDEILTYFHVYIVNFFFQSYKEIKYEFLFYNEKNTVRNYG